ncbi:hypothetical protein N7507_005619 [Penicillium longicatenatum]|nr:hypothetical protein N7507_005619 [Penicillium longicatenatum]
MLSYVVSGASRGLGVLTFNFSNTVIGLVRNPTELELVLPQGKSPTSANIINGLQLKQAAEETERILVEKAWMW